MEGNAQATGLLDGTYITEADLLQQLGGLPQRTFHRMIATGKGPAVTRLGRRKLYRRAAVTDWLRSMESGAKPVSRLDRARSGAEVQ